MSIRELLLKLSEIDPEKKVYLKLILKEQNVEKLREILNSLIKDKYKHYEFTDPILQLEKPDALKLIQNWYVAIKRDQNFLIKEIE